MGTLELTAVVFGTVFFLILLGIPIWISLGISGMVCALIFLNNFGVIQHAPWNVLTSFVLIAIPLFLLMGNIMLRSGLGTALYDGASALLRKMPGNLLHANITSCAIFAAISGSSVATAATIGTVAIPELEARGYDRKLVYGSLAAGGTLGILIPPSIGFIIYGSLVELSVGRLFIAGVFPGILLASLFMVYAGTRVIINPQLAPTVTEKMTLQETIVKVAAMWPVILLMAIVLGGIYLGIMTPTETAAVGAVIAAILALAKKRLTWSILKESLRETVKTTSWMIALMVGAQILSATVAMLQIPGGIVELVTALPFPPLIILMGIFCVYLFLGCFIDGFSMQVLTLPFVFPVITALGYDGIWFGVCLVILIEAALLTPPVGANVFVIHGLVPDRPVSEVIKGSMPFFLMMLVCLAILTAFPDIALWLPGTMRGG